MTDKSKSDSADNADNIVEFKSIQIWMRLVAIVFGVLVLTANLTDFKLTVISIFMISLGAFCLFLGMYKDLWVFNLSKKEAIRKIGLFLLPVQKTFSFSEIQTVNIYEFVRPLTKEKFSEIVLVFKNGKQIKLDYDKTEKIKDSVENAKILRHIFYEQNIKDLESKILNG